MKAFDIVAPIIAISLPRVFASYIGQGIVTCQDLGSNTACQWGNGKWQDFWNIRNNLCKDFHGPGTVTVNGYYQAHATFTGNDAGSTNCWSAMYDVIEYCLDTVHGGSAVGGTWCGDENCEEQYYIEGNPNKETNGVCNMTS